MCLILGAGASLAQAKSLRPGGGDWPPLDTTFFSAAIDRGFPLGPLRAYAKRLYRSDDVERTLSAKGMEDFFKELWFDVNDHPEADDLQTAFDHLLDVYQALIGETTDWMGIEDHGDAPIGRLIRFAADQAEQVTIITFNHDLVIENEIHGNAGTRSRWCVDRGYGSIGDELTRMFPADEIEEVEPADVFEPHSSACRHERPITVLKLHGSLNWFVPRGTHGGLSPSGDGSVYLLPARAVQTTLGERPTITAPDGQRHEGWPLLIPPVYAKHALQASIRSVWRDAHDALMAADRIVFFGYSVPPTDVEAEKLFQRTAGAEGAARWIDVINPDPAMAARFAALGGGKSIRWYAGDDAFFDEG